MCPDEGGEQDDTVTLALIPHADGTSTLTVRCRGIEERAPIVRMEPGTPEWFMADAIEAAAAPLIARLRERVKVLPKPKLENPGKLIQANLKRQRRAQRGISR